MRKLVISLGVVIALAAMLLVANTPIHFAKAMSCNSSASNSFGGASSSVSGSTGSCSTSSSSSSKPEAFFADAIGPKVASNSGLYGGSSSAGGSQSSCSNSFASSVGILASSSVSESVKGKCVRPSG